MPEWTATLGAIVQGAATTARVWAPDHDRVELAIVRREEGRDRVDVRALDRDEHGYWSGRFDDLPPGSLYRYRLSGREDLTFPDPASRYQPEGVHGPSQVVDPAAFLWTDEAWQPPPLDRVVIYELHVGTFTPAGTFRGVIDYLPALADLGVTAIELMPVGDFPGDRNWGYDGAAIFAPARCYGTPDDLRALVDAAHRRGLAVILDVVYNHFGPDGAYANAFSSHYFTDRHASPWGRGVNLDGPWSTEVRRFFLENAVQWLRDFHIDGLRLDATHALADDGPRHFLEELSATTRAHAGRPVLLIAEDHRNLSRLLLPPERGGFGIDAVWADDFHHQARVHTTGEQDGYYADFTGTAADLAETVRLGWFYTGQYAAHLKMSRGTDPMELAPRQFVVCLQNHDQVGNRADGARLNHTVDDATYRALTTLLLLSPQTPMLFMGQEWAATSPFLFFTDHHSELGRQITEGRREEFRAFPAFADPERRAAIPDPQEADTFERSRLVWDERRLPRHAHVLQLHRDLLALRRANSAWRCLDRSRYRVNAADDGSIVLDIRGSTPSDHRYLVIARLSGAGAVMAGEPGDVVLTTEDEAFARDRQAIRCVDEGRQVIFARPGAVVLRCAARRAT